MAMVVVMVMPMIVIMAIVNTMILIRLVYSPRRSKESISGMRVYSKIQTKVAKAARRLDITTHRCRREQVVETRDRNACQCHCSRHHYAAGRQWDDLLEATDHSQEKWSQYSKRRTAVRPERYGA